jgi:predicted ATPase
MIESITFKKDWRCFKAGEQVNFRPGINLLVGDQGCGKSSVLQAIRDIAITGDRRMKDLIGIKFTGKFRVSYFDTEKNNPRTMSYLDDGMGLFQVQSHFASHGQTMRPILEAMPEEGVLLVDEPDTALSPRSILDLIKLLRSRESRGMQLLVACHNPWLIEDAEEVLSLEHRRWLIPSEFLAIHRTRPVEKKTKSSRGTSNRKKESRGRTGAPCRWCEAGLRVLGESMNQSKGNDPHG